MTAPALLFESVRGRKRAVGPPRFDADRRRAAGRAPRRWAVPAALLLPGFLALGVGGRALAQDRPAPDRPAQALGEVVLQVASVPTGSAVFLRYAGEPDRYFGRTPAQGALELAVAPGDAEVVVYKDGFVCKVEPLALRSGGAARLEVRLTPDVEVPRGLVLNEVPLYVRTADEGEELFVALLAHVNRFYVEEQDPRRLTEEAVATLVGALDAVRRRERLLRRELDPEARRRYYPEEVDLSGYGALRFERAPAGPGKTRWTIGSGEVAASGVLDASLFDTYLHMTRQVWGFVKHEWDRRRLLSDAAITHALIEGLLAALDDDHTHFLTPTDVAELDVDRDGAFGGVGVVVSLKDGVLTVVTPMPGTPGERAGLQPGDVIVAIDGQPTDRITLRRAVELMRGKVDSPLELTFRRGDAVTTVSIVRARVEVRTTAHRMLGDGVGYLRVSSFMSERLDQAVSAALEELSAKGMRALVLDLRHNPGGLLEQAARLANLFLPPDLEVVSTRSRLPGEPRRGLVTDDSARKWSVPMAVLIDGESASASEILAGALRDHGRAVLIGERSFGKGSVQRVIPLEPYGCAVALTVSLYHLPSGATPHKVGVAPDVVVTLSEEEAAAVARASNYTVEGEQVDAQLAEAIRRLRGKP